MNRLAVAIAVFTIVTLYIPLSIADVEERKISHEKSELQKLSIPSWIVAEYGENPSLEVLEPFRHPWPNLVTIYAFKNEPFCAVTFSLFNFIDPGTVNYFFLCNLDVKGMPKEGLLVNPLDKESWEETRYVMSKLENFSSFALQYGIKEDELKKLRRKYKKTDPNTLLYDYKFFTRSNAFSNPTKYEIEVIEWFHDILTRSEFKIRLVAEPKPMKTVLPEGQKVSKHISRVRIAGIDYDEPDKEVILKRNIIKPSKAK